MVTLASFLAGMVTMGFATAGLFFFRFWHRTREVLFAIFGISFWLLAANQAMLVTSPMPREDTVSIFLLRLAAFGLLIAAIAAKNLHSRRR